MKEPIGVGRALSPLWKRWRWTRDARREYRVHLESIMTCGINGRSLRGLCRWAARKWEGHEPPTPAQLARILKKRAPEPYRPPEPKPLPAPRGPDDPSPLRDYIEHLGLVGDEQDVRYARAEREAIREEGSGSGNMTEGETNGDEEL